MKKVARPFFCPFFSFFLVPFFPFFCPFLLAGGDASNLYTDKASDYLAGGVGHDIYYVSHQDIINDADSTGFIMFNDKSLNGKKTKIDEYTYEDANFTYTLDGLWCVITNNHEKE